MKIFSTTQSRQADSFTIEHEKVSSETLIKNAGEACFQWFLKNICRTNGTEDIKLLFLCGVGNNGADGLAMALRSFDIVLDVMVVVVNHSDQHSPEFDKLKFQFPEGSRLIEIISFDQIAPEIFKFAEGAYIIDTLLGSGLNRPVNGVIGDCINFSNSQPNAVISLDIPSGMYGDKLNEINDIVVKAEHTLSFQFPKLAFLFPENFANVGDFEILDIGLSDEYTKMTSCKNHFIVKSEIKELLQTRNKNAHKGNFGHALIVAGSKGKIGAAVLSTQACMRTGAGLVTVHTPACGYEIIQISVPEAMVHADSEADFITDSIKTETFNAIGVGPGIRMEKQTQNILKLLIQNSNRPMVFDADAINILAENKTWLSFLPTNSILTPHIKEFERLVGKATNTQDRLKQQVDFATKYNVIVVLKGAYSSVATPQGELFFNSTGNPGMATGGSGDVLTGIITSLLAQGYSAFHASIIGVFLHGTAGDCASNQQMEETMIASDIIENISQAYSAIRSISI